MTKQHDIGHYLDGRVSIAFCKVCSAEGEKLLQNCPQRVPDKKKIDPLDTWDQGDNYCGGY